MSDSMVLQTTSYILGLTEVASQNFCYLEAYNSSPVNVIG